MLVTSLSAITLILDDNEFELVLLLGLVFILMLNPIGLLGNLDTQSEASFNLKTHLTAISSTCFSSIAFSNICKVVRSSFSSCFKYGRCAGLFSVSS